MFDTRSSIRELAYRLWEQEGRPEGREHAHWLEAERRVQSDAAAVAVAAPVKKVRKPAPKPTPAAAARTGRRARSESKGGVQTAG